MDKNKRRQLEREEEEGEFLLIWTTSEKWLTFGLLQQPCSWPELFFFLAGCREIIMKMNSRALGIGIIIIPMDLLSVIGECS